MNKLPKLTDKENRCLIRYLTNGKIKSEAYRFAYNCSKMSDNAVSVEASRFFNNPKITLWIETLEENQQQALQDELNYKAKEHFDELNEMKQIALDCHDKYHNPNINAALKAVELKGKMAGFYKDKQDNNSTNSFTLMGNISIDGKELTYQVGEDVNDDSTSADS